MIDYGEICLTEEDSNIFASKKSLTEAAKLYERRDCSDFSIMAAYARATLNGSDHLFKIKADAFRLCNE